MNLKQRALLEIAQGLAGFAVIATAVYFAPSILIGIVTLGVAVYSLIMLYEVILARLEREEQEKQQRDTKSAS